DGRSLNDGKETPAVQKTDKGIISFLQVNILPTGARKHSAQLTVADRCDHRHECRNSPNRYEPSGTSHVSDNVGADDKYTGADHRAGYNHRRIPKSQYWLELRFRHRSGYGVCKINGSLLRPA